MQQICSPAMSATPDLNNPDLAALFKTLSEYLDAVPRQREPKPPDLLAIFAHLDALEKKVQPVADAQLKHFLFQKSYRKAWQYLQGLPTEGH
jgi:hypothetical protein